MYDLYNLTTIYLNNFENIKWCYKFGSYIVYYKYINQGIWKGIDKFLFLFIYLLLIRIIKDIFEWSRSYISNPKKIKYFWQIL